MNDHKVSHSPLVTNENITQLQLHTEAYEPQIGDAVYYVRALHEDAISTFKSMYLHYEPSETSGSLENVPFNIFPWELTNELETDDDAVLCSIEDMQWQVITDQMKWF